MNIAKETVEQISALSRLHLAEPEQEQMAAELATIVSYMELLNRLPVEEAESVNCAFPAHNVLREDCVLPSLDRPQLLASAPASDGESFLVPKTVE